MAETESRFKPLPKRCIWIFRRHVWSQWWTSQGLEVQYKKCERCGKINHRIT